MITNMDRKVYLKSLKDNPRFTAEMLRLVEEDLKFGLMPGETKTYTEKKLDYGQMKVYSKCLRNGYGEPVMEVITKEGLAGEQMAVAAEFYEKGVPLETIREVTENTGKTALAMRKELQNAIEELEETRQNRDRKEANISELISRMEEAVEKINLQEQHCNKINEKLKELYTAGQDIKVQDNLISQLAEKDRMLEKQQEQLNRSRVEAVKLRQELEEVEKEKITLEKKIEEMEWQRKKGGQVELAEETGALAEAKKESFADRGGTGEQGKIPHFPAEYQVVLLDGNGRAVPMVPVERMEKRRDNKIISAFFSRMRLKRKIDVVRLVAERGLEPEQLVQIRNAINKKLTDQQLMVLIEHGLPAGQMKEIIDIAVYENGQKDGDIFR